jgi:hypothetical protein
MKTFYIIFLSLISIQTVQASQKRKVLIIGIAGIRSDALQKANTPTIDGVIAKGFYTYTSWHRGHTLSAPAWSTIMCGVEYDKHKVEDNTYAGNNYANYPYFPTRAKSCAPGLYCTQIVQWAPMSDSPTNEGWNKKIKVQYGAGDQSVAAAQTQLANGNLDVLFICFDEADIVGHNTGFSPTNAEYVKAIETIDGHINSVLTALHNRADYANEDWIVLLTTDYGGIGTTHGTNTDQERTIWWIGTGNKGISYQATGKVDPGSVAIGNYDPIVGAKNPAQYDIAVTALDHLLKGSSCIPTINPSWGLAGKSWLDSLHTELPNSVNNNDRNKSDIKVYPNPSTGIVSLWFENDINQPVSYKIINALGEVAGKSEYSEGIRKNKLNIDFTGKPSGIYYVELKVGSKVITKKIIHNQ